MTDYDHADLVRDIVRQVSKRPADDIGPDTRIADLGIDSVAFAEIVVQIEEALGIDVPFARWLSVRTVREVLEMIDEAAAQGAAQAGQVSAAATPSRAGRRPEQDDPQSGNTRAPIEKGTVMSAESTDRLEFNVTGMDIDIVETIPINWQGREIDSGPIHIGLGEAGSCGVIDYAAGTVSVEFRSLVEFPELAETLEELGADPSVYAPVSMVIRSTGAVLDGHCLRLAGKGTIGSHRLFTPEQTRIDVRAPSQCKPDVGAGDGDEIREALRNGKSVSWNFNPAEPRVELTLPEALGGKTHLLSLSGSYTLTIASPDAATS
jgi:acyl carrier protein